MLLSLTSALLIGLICSDTTFGRNVRQQLSSLRLRPPKRGEVLLAAAVFILAALLVGFLKEDGLALGARALPEGMAWLTALDVATYVDVVLLTTLAALALRIRGVWAVLKAVAERFFAAVATIRARFAGRGQSRRPMQRKADEDNDGWRGIAFA